MTNRRCSTLSRWAIAIIAAVAGTTAAWGLPRTADEVQQILQRLDNELHNRSVYIDIRQRSIDSLETLLSRSPSNLDALARLGHLYTSFNNDSALAVFDRGCKIAAELGCDSAATALRIKRASLLPLAGFMNEAQNEMAAVDTALLSAEMKIRYFVDSRQMYSYMSAYYHRFPPIEKYYSEKTVEAQLALLKLLDTDDPDYLLNQGEYYFLTEQYVMSETLLQELLTRLPESDNRFARACHIVADIAKARGNDNNYIYYLALSAISDTKVATREVTSLQELGQMMFSHGDIQRAHDYLYTALSNAVECNAETRMLQVAESMPLIESVHQAELSSSRTRIYIVIGCMIVALMLLIIALVMLRIKIMQMKQLQNHLEQTNTIKEEYISQFLNLCSIYMDKLNQFCQIANRKISTGKVDDLYKLTKSGKFVENQSKEFYEVFDNAFIHIHPGFADRVNELLRPECRITLQEGELLNTDLRILAFMRLGIDDSARIAQILNYSINTIYTYRNKLKNRAIHRETFEADIQSI